jgi:FdrA protein
VVFALLGESVPDLTAAVEAVLRALGRPAHEPWPAWLPASPRPAPGGPLHGLFAGGTLRDEADLIAGAAGLVPAPSMVDFGDDRLTAGRPHPMIDGSLRIEALARVTAGVVLLDVVLGYAADPDPTARLAPALAAAGDRGVVPVVSLIGTAGDPQGLPRQAAALRDAGAAVFASNAEAARYAVTAARSAA